MPSGPANGITLAVQIEVFSMVITFDSNDSVRTSTQRGVFDKVTVPGGGLVPLDTRIANSGGLTAGEARHAHPGI